MPKILSKYKKLPPYLKWGDITTRSISSVKLVKSLKHQAPEYALKSCYKPIVILYGTR